MRIIDTYNPPGNNKTIYLQLLYYVLKYIILSIIMQENRITKIKFCQLSQMKIIQLLNNICLPCGCSWFFIFRKKDPAGTSFDRCSAESDLVNSEIATRSPPVREKRTASHSLLHVFVSGDQERSLHRSSTSETSKIYLGSIVWQNKISA